MVRSMVGGSLETVGELYLGNSGRALGELRMGRAWGQSVKRGVWAGSPANMGNEKM